MNNLETTLSTLTYDALTCRAAVDKLPPGEDKEILKNMIHEIELLKKSAQAAVSEKNNKDDFDLSELLGSNETEDYNKTSALEISPLLMKVKCNDIPYMSVMHAFQAHKVLYDKKYDGMTDMDDEQQKRMKLFADEELTTVTVWGSSRGNIRLDIAKWDRDKEQIMKDLLLGALTQNANKARILQNTNGYIEEDTIRDDFWGGSTNKIGTILQDIRENEKLFAKKVKKESSSSFTIYK